MNLRSKYFYAGIAVATIAGGALFLFWPMLFGKLIFAVDFSGHYHYIYFTAMQNFIYKLGMMPNWWPAYNSGYPINLTLDGFLNPFFIIALKYLPPFFANNLMQFIFFVVNGLSLYAFCRTLKLSTSGSLIAAISYAFSGIIMRWAAVTGVMAVMLFLPLSFLCCLKIFQGKIKWCLPWFLLLIYSWIGGWAETMVYALTAVGFFAIYLMIKNRKSENFKYRYPLLFFGIVLLSMIFLLPWFLAVLHFIGYSTRTGGIDITSAANGPTGISRLINVFNPRLSVFNGEILPLIPIKSYEFFLYIGTFSFLLVLTSLFIKNKKGKEHLIFFMCLAAGSILMTINHSPLFWLFHQIPVLRWFQGYWKWSFVITFSLGILAGYGMDNIKDFFTSRFNKKVLVFFWSIMILAILMSGTIAVFDQKIKTAVVNYGISHYKNTPDRAFNRSEDYYRHNIEEMANSLVNGFSLKNKWVLLMTILWLLALIHLTIGKYEFMSFQNWRIMAVLVALLGSVLPWTGLLSGPPVADLKNEPTTAAYLHSINPYQSNQLPITAKISSLEPYRIFIYTPEQFIAFLSEKYKVDLAKTETRYLLTRELMDENFHIMFNFDTFYNHQTLGLGRLVDLAFYLTKRQKITPFNNTASLDEYVKEFSGNKSFALLGALNIKYILTPLKLTGSLQPIFTTYAFDQKLPVYIYQNPYFLPRWYFAENIKWTKSDDKTAFEDLKTIADFHKTTLIEQLGPNDSKIIAAPSAQDKIELQLYTAGKLTIKTKTKNYRFLIFSENIEPTFWQAKINGASVPLYTANYLYQAVLVPPGENTVEFVYPNLWEQGIIAGQSRLQFLLQ